MSQTELAKTIDDAFEQRDAIGPSTKGPVREAVEATLDLLDRGAARVAERGANGDWRVNQWLKKAVLLSFRLNDMSVIAGGPGKAAWWDKVASKFDGWNDARFREAGFRAVPNCVVRRSAYIAPGVVLMPSFVNLGAYVDAGTMVDTWATVGSCAQIGKKCHISGGAGIGGVLEPLQAGPVIVEDNCFIGARSEVAEGVIVREGSVLSMGVFIGASTRIVDRETGETFQGEVPRLFGRRSGLAARQADEGRRAGSKPLLRGDRQARRREDARENLDQRIVAGLNRVARAQRLAVEPRREKLAPAGRIGEIIAVGHQQEGLSHVDDSTAVLVRRPPEPETLVADEHRRRRRRRSSCSLLALVMVGRAQVHRSLSDHGASHHSLHSAALGQPRARAPSVCTTATSRRGGSP